MRPIKHIYNKKAKININITTQTRICLYNCKNSDNYKPKKLFYKQKKRHIGALKNINLFKLRF